MATPIWNPELAPLILKQKKYETADAVSFYFQSPQKERFIFKPGQFITIKASIDGQTQARAYSISSLPEEDTLQLTIKRVKDGIVSNWMIDHLQPGESLWSYGFGGDFNIYDLPPKEQVIFISAGCGITPVMGMARHLMRMPDQKFKSIDFIHRARGHENIIYHDELILLAQQHSNFREHFVLGNDVTRGLSERMYTGTIDREFLEKACPDFKKASVYLCGPVGFMQTIETLLNDIGFDCNNLHQEKFLLSLHEPCQLDENEHMETITVSVPSLGISHEANPGDILFNVLEKAKAPLIGACRAGVCGSCKCRVVKGKVEISSQATLSQQEKENNYVLACSSRIIEDVEIALR